MARLSAPPPRLADILHSYLQEDGPMIRVLQEMRDGVMICDETTGLLFYNASLKDTFLLRRSALNQPCEKTFMGDSSEELSSSIVHVLKSRESTSKDMTFRCLNLEKNFQVNIVPLRLPIKEGMDGPKTLNGCLVMFHDMTAIHRTEKMRRDFVANVSHELRTPLSAIKGYTETLLDGALDDANVSRDFVEVIFKHSLRLTRLVEDLLDLSKLESPDFIPELRATALTPLIDRVLALVQDNTTSKASGKNLSFSVDIPETLPKVLASPDNLEQVLTNLLDNAVKYTPEGGSIKVTAQEFGSKLIQVNVLDTGIGIDEKHISRLFERFYRVDKARSRDMGGTGLGLSIVKHIVQYHGGDIWVTSKDNQGSTFSFTLQKAIG
ncbi:MAG: GHKL domain-containing protein [Vampirovibrio sp.]|nr:GHKL domain-containing protein [Vampirovibrio sp.]